MQATIDSPAPPKHDDGTDPIEVSVVMPCLNEVRTVGVCIVKAREALKRFGVASEIIIADNGSTDGSQALAIDEGARVVPVSRRGYGSALQAGIAAARGKFIIMGDSDDSYDFTGLAPFIEKLREGNELVMGNRFRGGISKGAMPWHHRYIGNPILTGILNLFFHTPIRDAHCGLRGFRKESYERLGLTTPGMEFASEMVVKASLQGQRITEVPTTLRPDGRDRPPHLRSFRDGWRHLRFLLLLCPLWLYLIPALFMSLAGLALMAWLTPGPQPLGNVEIDVHTMMLGSLCLILGNQTLWLWAYAYTFGKASGILPAKPWSERVLANMGLERGLILGGGLLLLGLILNGSLVGIWYGQHLGPLHVQTTMRWAIWGCTTMVVGAQIMFGSFFLTMLHMMDKPELKNP
jgi:glycosyltransferase involved in cell wall biosynthesis